MRPPKIFAADKTVDADVEVFEEYCWRTPEKNCPVVRRLYHAPPASWIASSPPEVPRI
jgi:hypothetical protein